MGLLTNSQVEYYNGRNSFTGDGTTVQFTLSKNPNAFPHDGFGSLAEGVVEVFINKSLYPQVDLTTGLNNYEIKFDTITQFNVSGFLGWYVEFSSGLAPASAAAIEVEITVQKWGSYQFASLKDIINNFMIAYVGEDKIISKVNRTDVQFHAQRALAELSFDTFKSTKSQELTIPPSLTMILPQDYINYVKLVWKDSSGIERVIYPASKTSNPSNPKQNTDGSFNFDEDDDGIENRKNLIPDLNSETWDDYSSASTPTENQDYYGDNAWFSNEGRRYGLDPVHAQANGSFFIDDNKGLIHFSSNISGETVILKYISDSLGQDDEMVVHKLVEEAMYKWITYAILSTRSNIPEYVVQRSKKEKFAETRKAKLRLSNIKLEELTQILRGKSKQIKH